MPPLPRGREEERDQPLWWLVASAVVLSPLSQRGKRQVPWLPQGREGRWRLHLHWPMASVAVFSPLSQRRQRQVPPLLQGREKQRRPHLWWSVALEGVFAESEGAKFGTPAAAGARGVVKRHLWQPADSVSVISPLSGWAQLSVPPLTRGQMDRRRLRMQTSHLLWTVASVVVLSPLSGRG